ncbi:MAG: hypothetical protein M1832_006075 [Thelocarpon impressellum]|nr:MAG: hypothetical protein M1832_006075 [Thelocarpon impressellum]
MGCDYALVHLKYTVPPAIALTLLYRPLCSRLDTYKILFLVGIAVVSTVPWDSYLIRRRIWTYPAEVVAGPTLFSIPLEEVFFFVVQTYNTSLLYLLLSKPTLHPAYLGGKEEPPWDESESPGPMKVSGHGNEKKRIVDSTKRVRSLVQLAIAVTIICGGVMVWRDREETYLGLILIWAGPFVLLLWSLSYRHILRLPMSNTLAPIVIPTLYLWVVDTLALKRGTWVIESGTKLGVHVWDGLEIEEAVFFLATNALIVFGLVAFDNALAIVEAFPDVFPIVPSQPSPALLVRALLLDAAGYNRRRIRGLQLALTKLRSKSRSFYLASAFFEGRLRIDLMLLYSFCRVADDLVDDAPSAEEARRNVARLRRFLDLSYAEGPRIRMEVDDHVRGEFPPEVRFALLLLPTEYLSSEPLYGLLDGFETDLQFRTNGKWPIADQVELQLYASRVAGTVAALCLELIMHHTTSLIPAKRRRDLIEAGGRMGVALQHVNIARDIAVDARMGRVYLPTSWLEKEGAMPENVLLDPEGPVAVRLRTRVLDDADAMYVAARPAIDSLPAETRGPMRVAVESYMEIGRVLRTEGYRVKAGRATVPTLRRLQVVWKAMAGG